MENMEEMDVMISYSGADCDFVKTLAECIRRHGLKVWFVDPSLPMQESLRQRGQGVINCKVFVAVMSVESAGCKLFNDQLALAYISNTAIFPIGRLYFRKVAAHMNGAMKLMLAKINWSFIVKDEDFDTNVTPLVESMKHEIHKLGMEATAAPPIELEEELEERNYRRHINKRNLSTLKLQDEGEKGGNSSCFWVRNFSDKTQVTWHTFKEIFLWEYKENLKEDFMEKQLRWFLHLLYKDIFLSQNTISKKKYDKFCGELCKDDADHFYNRLKEYAIGSFAMKEVLEMDSTVRLTAIQNLGTFHTPGVIRTLLDLLDDPDPNIRAVAALALAKTKRKSKKVVAGILKLLKDEDRLVRESSCLSLAHMRATSASADIIDLWRNDPISHVRDAAKIALSRLGGEEAQQAIKVTQVLSKEMKDLQASKDKLVTHL